MLTGSVNIDTNDFFTCSYLSTTTGNSMKLFKPQITSMRDGNFFADHVISHWNSLLNSFVSSPSVAIFKQKLGSLNFHGFTCNFSVMPTCNTGHLSAQDYTCLDKSHFYVLLLILIYHTSVCFASKFDWFDWLIDSELGFGCCWVVQVWYLVSQDCTKKFSMINCAVYYVWYVNFMCRQIILCTVCVAVLLTRQRIMTLMYGGWYFIHRTFSASELLQHFKLSAVEVGKNFSIV